MEKFSTIYGIDKDQAELDFVDITPGSDIPLYLDPYALTTREDTWSQEACELVVSFFHEVVQSVKLNNRARGERLLSHLGEPAETHLGVSQEGNSGRGVGSVQAAELYTALQKSRASKTGLLNDLADLALFIPGIGRDKISDMTTNIIRKSLIDYTQDQCTLYSVPTINVPSGFYWDPTSKEWMQSYVLLPVHGESKILLVPKHAVRYKVGVDHSKFRRMFVLEFLQEEHLRANDSLVSALTDKNGSVTGYKVYKKTVDHHYPKDKDFLAEFSLEHPEIVDEYKESLKDLASKIPSINDENFTEEAFATVLKNELTQIPKGSSDANSYHNFCIGVLSFIFFPNLIYPKKENEINQGRKRIDISYTNGKSSGLFYRISLDQHIKANTVEVECKNYTNEIRNPEIDQLIGRFDGNRGKLGILMFRESEDMNLLIQRCSDVAKQTLGVILPMDDKFIYDCLTLIEEGKRSSIDSLVDSLYRRVTR